MDVDDVAAAHTLAMVLPQAHGRYLVSARSVLLTEVAGMLRWVRACGRSSWNRCSFRMSSSGCGRPPSQGDVSCTLGAAVPGAAVGCSCNPDAVGHHEVSLSCRQGLVGGKGLPTRCCQTWACLLPHPSCCSYRWVRALFKRTAEVDCGKAQLELGLDFIPLQQASGRATPTVTPARPPSGTVCGVRHLDNAFRP